MRFNLDGKIKENFFALIELNLKNVGLNRNQIYAQNLCSIMGYNGVVRLFSIKYTILGILH